MNITRTCSSHAWLRRILLHEYLQGESRAQGLLAEGSRKVGGLPSSLFSQISLLLAPWHDRLPVSVLAELSVKQMP